MFRAIFVNGMQSQISEIPKVSANSVCRIYLLYLYLQFVTLCLKSPVTANLHVHDRL
jgi:hypothetical protein